MDNKLQAVRIENFKAISSVRIPLSSGLTVLVGQNSSGKSSALQAIHWACRCVANSRIQRNQTRSISVGDFDFYPTTNVRSVGKNRELRQGRGNSPEVSVDVIFEHTKADSDEPTESRIKISQGNNEAVKVDLKEEAIELNFYNSLNDRERPFSSYIPGLAGVALVEEKRSRLPVLRQAASGDANTVLRNILYLIRVDERPEVNLEKLSELCSEVLGGISIDTSFNEREHSSIQARIRTQTMAEDYWTPLEMAGTGVLQCIQIFAYVILYRPQLLLIDEPDAHLHPDRQERLVTALANVASQYSMSILLTTHSPNVVRAMPSHANIVWMNDGEVQHEQEETIRKRMGWGILDKKILLITEDRNPDELRAIIKQWPELDRIISVWPVSGHKSLPTLPVCESLLDMTDMEHLILHRDGDFMTPDERSKLYDKYHSARTRLWITDSSDIEAHFLDKDRVARIFQLGRDEVDNLYNEIIEENLEEFENLFSSKRQELIEDRRLWDRRDEAPRLASARRELQNNFGDFGSIHGKIFSKRLKGKLNSKGLDSSKLLTICEDDPQIAESLRETILSLTGDI